jgi:hypothetical protein
MIHAAGSAPGLTSYDFFSGELFGLDVPLERVVSYFETAAHGHETRRRILLDPARAAPRSSRPRRCRGCQDLTALMAVAELVDRRLDRSGLWKVDVVSAALRNRAAAGGEGG